MELVVIASGLVSAVVGVAAFVRAEVHRRRAQHNTQRLVAVFAVALCVTVLAWTLHRQQ